MTFKLADRVKEFTSSSGTGGVSFTGAAVGFRRFRDVLSDGDTTYYVIEENDKYEIGIGTYGSDNLERTTVLVSSNSNTQVNLGGSGVVFITYPADHAIFTDPQNEANIGIGNLSDAFTTGTPVSTNLMTFDSTNNSLLIGDRTGEAVHSNTFIGYGAASGITTGYSNTIIGHNSSTKNEGGFENVSIGAQSGPIDLGGSSTVYRTVTVGYQAGSKIRQDSTVIGFQAAKETFEIDVVAVGYQAGEGAGAHSISIGKNAGYNSSNDYVVAIGYQSAYDAGGESSIWIGNKAGYQADNATRSIGIGLNAGRTATADDSIYIGRSAGYGNTTDDLLFIGKNTPESNSTLIKGDMSSKKLAVGNADVTLSDTFYIGISSSTDVGLAVQSAASQTADLTQWKDYSGDVFARVKHSGVIESATFAATGVGYYFPDGTVQFSAAEAGTLTNIYQNAQGHIGIGVINPQSYLHVSGNTRIDGDLTVAATNLVIGSGALSANYDYVGMKHTAMTGSNDYMIISSGTDTFVSAANDSTLFLRAGGNAAESEIRLYDVAAGSVGIVFNEAGSDRDVRMEGVGDINLFRLDASTDKIGIGVGGISTPPEHKLDVRGNIQAKDTSAKIQTVDGSVITKIQSDSSASVGYFGTESNNDLRIRTNNTDVGVFTTDGSMGLGKTSLTSSTKLDIDTANKDYGVIAGGTNGASISFLSNASITGVKSSAVGFYSYRFPSTSDADLGNLIHFRAGGPYSSTASSTAVTSNIGFYAASGVRYNASNAFGFYGGIEEGSNHWNLYMFGSGQNYLAGNVGIGTDTPQYPLEVHGNKAPGPWINQQAGTTGDASTIVLQQRTADVRMGVVYSYSTNYDGGSFLSVGASGTAFANIEGPVAVGTLASKPLTLGTASIERIRVAEGGYVGIGTSEPAYKLDVAGTGNFDYLNVNDNDSLLSIAGNASKRAIFNEDAHADYDVRIEGASDVNLFRTDGSSNKVGVGLIPSSKFHVSGGVARFDGNIGLGTAGTTNVSIYSRNQTVSVASTHYGFFMQDDVAGGCTDHLGFIYSAKSTQNSINTYTAFDVGNAKTINANRAYGYFITSGALVGSVNNYGFYSLVPKDGNKNYNLYMNSEAPNYIGGNLGIMTTTPSVPLSVYPTGISDTSTPAHDELFNKVVVYQDSPTTNVAGFGVSTSSFNIATSGGMHQRFWTNSTERMRISSAGNVGIGTINPTYLLDVSGSARVSSLNVNSQFNLPTVDGSPNQLLKTDGAGNLFWSTTAAAGIGAVVDDLTPQLGGNLDLNNYEIHGTGKINIMLGTGVITHTDGTCGLIVQDTGGSGVHIGDCAYNSSTQYSGMKHSEHTNNNEYMIISRGLNTFISAKSGASSFIRAGNNDAVYQAVVSTTFFGVGHRYNRLRIDSTGAIFNTGCTADLDFQVNPFGDEGHLPLIHADAALHSVGIGTNAPDSLLHVKNTGVVTDFKNVVQIEGDIDTNSSPYTETLALIGTGLSGSASIGFGQYSYSVIKSEHDTDGSITAGKLDFYIRSTASSPTVNMTLNSSGNLIVTPENNNDYAVRIGNKSGGGGAITGVTLIGLDHWNPTDEFASAEIGVVENSTAAYKSNIVFNTRDTSANVKATEKVRITHDGNIGVGTTEPALQSAGRGIHIHDTTSSEIKFTNDTTESTATDGTALVLDSNSFTINNREVGDLFFSTSNTQRMQILYQGDVRIKGDINDNLFYTDASANRVGIGTSSPTVELDIEQAQSRLYQNATDPTSFASHYFYSSGLMLGGLLAYGSGYTAGSYMNLGSGTFHLFSNYEALAIQTGGVNKPIVFGTNTNSSGGERMRITGDGDIGIGTTTPGHNLDVAGSGRFSGNLITDGDFIASGDAQINHIQIGSQAYSIGSHTQGITHEFYDNSSSYMIISDGTNTYTSCHNLGGFNYMRGPQNANTYQVVVGNTYMFIGTTTNERMTVGSTETVFNQDGRNFDFRVEGSGDTAALFVHGEDGNVGIGTSSPGSKLEVENFGNTTIRATNSADNIQNILNVDSTKGYVGTTTDHNLSIGTRSTSRIHIKNDSDINNQPAIGINTTSPTNNLDVYATGIHKGITVRGDNAPALLLWDNTLPNGGSRISDQTGAGSGASGILILDADTNNVGDNSYMSLRVDGTEKVHINSSGNVGVGTSSPTGVFEIHPTIQSHDVNTINIARNAGKASIKAVGGGATTSNQWLVMDSAGRGAGDYASINHFVDDDVLLAYGGGNVGINNAAPAFDLDITGSGRITHNDGKCGLFIEDANGSGIHLGDCAYSSSSAYSGMKHSNHNGSTEYMIISSGHSTLVSSATGAGTYLRAGNNDSTYQALITDTTFGIGTNSDRIRVNSQGVIFNNDLGNYDFRIMPFGVDAPTLHVDASSTTGGAAGRIGVGRYADDYMIDVSGGLRISPLATATRNITVNRNASTPSITADGDTAQNQWLIMDSAGQRCALNYFVTDDVVLCHGGGGVGIGTNAAPGSYALRVEGGTAAFNASQIEAANFRVFGEDDDALIFGDAGLNQVGLGTSVPRTKLEVFGSGVAGQAKIEGTILSRTFHHDSYAGLLIRDRDDVNIGSFQYGGSGTSVISNEIAIGSRQDATPVVFYQGAASAGQGLADRDKRLTFDTDRNAVFQTGVNVGIGDTSPNVPLSITPASYAVTATPNIDEALNKLRLYDVDGNGVAGFGVSTSTFNIATSGAINQDFWTNGSQAMQIGHSAGTVGIGADAVTQYHLYVHTDITNSTRRGAYIDIDAETTETEVTKFNIGQTIDLRKNVHHEIRDSGYALGLDVNGLIDGSGYSRSAYGARTYGGGYTGFGEGGVIDYTYGLYSRALNFGSGTMTNAYGLFSVVQKVHSGGTITNGYGLYINAIGTHATNPYGIYQAGTDDDNYLAGNVMIGRTTSHEFTGYKTLSIDGTSGSFIDLYDSGEAELRIQGNTEHQTIQTLNLSPLRFSTNQTERMRIGPSGNVGIGTTTPAQVLDVTTSETEGFGINLAPVSTPAGSGDYQSLITENRSDSIITKHLENVANSSSTLVMKNLIRYGADFVSIDGAYTTGLGTTFDPKLVVNTDSGNVGIGTTDPANRLYVAGGDGTAYIQSGIITPSIAFRTADIPKTGATIYDGFIAYQTSDCWGLGNNNHDGFVFEKTDGNDAIADGGIFFNVRGNDGVSSTAMSINGRKEIFIGQTGTYVAQGYSLNVAGGATFADSVKVVHPDGSCGLMVEDTGGSGVHIGDCAYLTGSTYTGMKHSKHTNSSEYMIISRGDWTLLSGKDGYGSIIRGGNNNASSEIRVYDATAGTNGVVINEQGSDVDTRIEGTGDPNLFKVDASADSIGIGTNSPAYKLDVAGSGGFAASVMVGSGVVLPNAVPSDTSNKLYNDAGTLKFNGSSITGGKTDEEIQDIVGGMVSGNTESGISVTYDDAGDGTGKLDFAVASQTDENFTTADHTKLDNIEALADVTDATNVDAAGAVMNSDTSTASMGFVVDEDTMSSNSATKVPTQQSVKAYVDSKSDTVLVETVNGRLTLETGVAVSTTNQTAKTTLYFTPYKGNQIALYSGSAWAIHDLTERSLSLSGYTADTNFDIFIYDNSGTLTLESVAWTDDTTRATALTTQDGVYVKNGATTRRYLGTIRTTATTGQCEDSRSRRFVWSYYNQVKKDQLTSHVATTHTYATSTWRATNNDTTVGVKRYLMVLGLDTFVSVSVNNHSKFMYTSAAIDGTTASERFDGLSGHNGDPTYNGQTFSLVRQYIASGYHFIQELEYGVSSSSVGYNSDIAGEHLC